MCVGVYDHYTTFEPQKIKINGNITHFCSLDVTIFSQMAFFPFLNCVRC